VRVTARYVNSAGAAWHESKIGKRAIAKSRKNAPVRRGWISHITIFESGNGTF